MAHQITPATKVAELLEHWPELEPVLVAQAPAFQKLRNPVLRRTIARVATLEQAAGIAGLSPRALVTTLRRAAGQPVDEVEALPQRQAAPPGGPASAPASPCRNPGHPGPADRELALPASGDGTAAARDPADFAGGRAVEPAASDLTLIDADALLEAGGAPLAPVFEAARALAPGAALQVLVSFRPVPLVEKLESHGYRCEIGRSPDGRVLLSVRKPASA